MARKKQVKPVVVEVGDLTDESLKCRDLRHPFDHVTDLTLVRIKGAAAIITRHLRCPRCQTERFDTYAVPSFDLLKSRTVYPEGYLTKGTGHHARVRDVRRELFSRTSKVKLPAG